MNNKFRTVHLSSSSKVILFAIAIMVAGFSLFYTNWLVKKLKIQEKKKIELWAEAYFDILQTDLTQSVSLISFKIIQENNTIPVIMTDDTGKIIAFANLDSTKASSDKYLQLQLEKMKKQNEPIEIDFSSIHKNYIFYSDSKLLVLLQKYPFFQAGLVIMFVLVAYILLVISKKAEDNIIWVGMSKETAHQLGTPISSLLAWVEMMKIKQQDDPLVPEVEKDVKRLVMITERFARIGSEPKLTEIEISEVIKSALDYLKPRTSAKIKYKVNNNCGKLKVNLNSSLFQWVIENLCKNSIDAMNGSGEIVIDLNFNKNIIYIDVTDTGKGMSKSEQKRVFNPGFTTKKYGWGLGLALVKRIIEQYHNGKIYIFKSVQGKGTTFRIELFIG